eukprot:TRINITY_DN8053_c0_g1_i2.p1 TRINITY_DN8053_c0_g1~~TRINITY_DN8053_c0_g1_i2.p1  ORF type:complete len:200 (-),score=42.31 TRINITY_DN8053_c0_g1_i2:111-710(-)
MRMMEVQVVVVVVPFPTPVLSYLNTFNTLHIYSIDQNRIILTTTATNLFAALAAATTTATASSSSSSSSLPPPPLLPPLPLAPPSSSSLSTQSISLDQLRRLSITKELPNWNFVKSNEGLSTRPSVMSNGGRLGGALQVFGLEEEAVATIRDCAIDIGAGAFIIQVVFLPQTLSSASTSTSSSNHVHHHHDAGAVSAQN